MIFLRELVAGASFLLCLVLGAAGGLLVLSRSATTQIRGGTVEVSVYVGGSRPPAFWGGLPAHIWAGTAVGGLLGALVAYQVWSLLGRRSRESSR